MWIAFWTWLAGLPQGSASFVGTLAGSSLGLIAILIGALVKPSRHVIKSSSFKACRYTDARAAASAAS